MEVQSQQSLFNELESQYFVKVSVHVKCEWSEDLNTACGARLDLTYGEPFNERLLKIHQRWNTKYEKGTDNCELQKHDTRKTYWEPKGRETWH